MGGCKQVKRILPVAECKCGFVMPFDISKMVSGPIEKLEVMCPNCSGQMTITEKEYTERFLQSASTMSTGSKE